MHQNFTPEQFPIADMTILIASLFVVACVVILDNRIVASLVTVMFALLGWQLAGLASYTSHAAGIALVIAAWSTIYICVRTCNRIASGDYQKILNRSPLRLKILLSDLGKSGNVRTLKKAVAKNPDARVHIETFYMLVTRKLGMPLIIPHL